MAKRNERSAKKGMSVVLLLPDELRELGCRKLVEKSVVSVCRSRLVCKAFLERTWLWSAAALEEKMTTGYLLTTNLFDSLYRTCPDPSRSVCNAAQDLGGSSFGTPLLVRGADETEMRISLWIVHTASKKGRNSVRRGLFQSDVVSVDCKKVTVALLKVTAF